jgi:phage gp46-like protein
MDRRINPATGDYVWDHSEGEPAKTRDASTAIWHQMRTKRNGWVGDPDAGNRLHEVARGKSSTRTPSAIADIIAEAMQPLAQEGLVTEPVIRTEREGDTIEARTFVTDRQSREEVDLTTLVAVNE